MTDFILGFHCHQPLGNFDEVFQDSTARAYLPILKALEDHRGVQVVLHFSGCLLEWTETKAPEVFDRIGGLVSRGQAELLGGGFYEPLLPVIPERDAVGQIEALRAYLQGRFGARVRGIWLAERVWEPQLARTLAAAGVEYLPVDDTHLLGAGLGEADLDRAWLTGEGEESLSLYAIREPLRYLIPFRPVQETLDWLRILGDRRREGEPGPLAVMADDGEKFGVWPGTSEWVFGKGWFEGFLSALEENRGWLRTTTFSERHDRCPPRRSIHVPPASYFEMGEWALPVAAGRTLRDAIKTLRGEGRFETLRPFLKGGNWRYFLTKYPESGHLLSRACNLSRQIAEAASGAARAAGRGLAGADSPAGDGTGIPSGVRESASAGETTGGEQNVAVRRPWGSPLSPSPAPPAGARRSADAGRSEGMGGSAGASGVADRGDFARPGDQGSGGSAADPDRAAAGAPASVARESRSMRLEKLRAGGGSGSGVRDGEASDRLGGGLQDAGLQDAGLREVPAGKPEHATVGEDRLSWELEAARRVLWQAQCNCPYWHGVFGGIYLPFLRAFNESALVRARRLYEEAVHDGEPWLEIRAAGSGEGTGGTVRVDTRWLGFSADPALGGALLELESKEHDLNVAAVLARREEIYHDELARPSAPATIETPSAAGGTPSIHDRPPAGDRGPVEGFVYDSGPRLALLDHLYEGVPRAEDLAAGRARELTLEPRPRDSAAGESRAPADLPGPPCSTSGTDSVPSASGPGGRFELRRSVTGALTLGLGDPNGIRRRKALEVGPEEASLTVTYEVAAPSPDASGSGAAGSGALSFGPEIPAVLWEMHGRVLWEGRGGAGGEESLSFPADVDEAARLTLTNEQTGLRIGIELSPPAPVRTYPLRTISRSESGYEEIYQGTIVQVLWRVPAPGEPPLGAILRLRLARGESS